MWVIHNETTGYEIDRVESREERDEMLSELNSDANYENFGYTYGYRWEA
jgi:hypothetical protein